MQHKELRTYTSEVTAKVTCDLCGDEVNRRKYDYYVDEIELSRRVGDHYPEGDFTRVTEADLCGKCWDAKVFPALEALGIKFRTRDSE